MPRVRVAFVPNSNLMPKPSLQTQKQPLEAYYAPVFLLYYRGRLIGLKVNPKP